MATRVIDGNTDLACLNQAPSAANRQRFGVSSLLTISGRKPSKTQITALRACMLMIAVCDIAMQNDSKSLGAVCDSIYTG
ncbi:MAG: hypothetical protein MnENMB40S_15150 [Rhizobiaceae bacterium MnEN-MB40S]|nr:MAG: hypothetical protein MnENMB40S_15150 [Rhizobiaceae bacterium MnEN-MB40S]